MKLTLLAAALAALSPALAQNASADYLNTVLGALTYVCFPLQPHALMPHPSPSPSFSHTHSLYPLPSPTLSPPIHPLAHLRNRSM